MHLLFTLLQFSRKIPTIKASSSDLVQTSGLKKTRLFSLVLYRAAIQNELASCSGEHKEHYIQKQYKTFQDICHVIVS